MLQVLQYKQKCSQLENQMIETIPCDSSKRPIATVSSTSALEAAHQTLRDIREEQIHDLDTALSTLGEERRRYVEIGDADTKVSILIDQHWC